MGHWDEALRLSGNRQGEAVLLPVRKERVLIDQQILQGDFFGSVDSSFRKKAVQVTQVAVSYTHLLAAVVIFALGGISSKSQVSACNTDAKTVQLAVTAFQTQNPTYTTAISSTVLTGTSYGGPYLQSWPSSTNGYAISLSGSTAATTTVQVAIGTGAPTTYTGASSCTGA